MRTGPRRRPRQPHWLPPRSYKPLRAASSVLDRFLGPLAHVAGFQSCVWCGQPSHSGHHGSLGTPPLAFGASQPTPAVVWGIIPHLEVLGRVPSVLDRRSQGVMGSDGRLSGPEYPPKPGFSPTFGRWGPLGGRWAPQAAPRPGPTAPQPSPKRYLVSEGAIQAFTGPSETSRALDTAMRAWASKACLPAVPRKSFSDLANGAAPWQHA